MKFADFIQLIVSRCSYTPTADQMSALDTFAHFLGDRSARTAMVLCGSAGTGKTSLTGAMMQTFHSLGQKLVPMAPTGRAAKVLQKSCGLPSFTIHRKIYREKSYQGIGGEFALNNNLYKNTLFVVDEASMCTAQLLSDLVRYVYSGMNCRILFIGDSAQLPPIGEDEAPALSPDVLHMMGLTVYECNMSEVRRQNVDSGILLNATSLRMMIERGNTDALPQIKLHGFADLERIDGQDIVDYLSSSYDNAGVNETIVITRSNKAANIYNNGIRQAVLDLDDVLCPGDRIMIVKNKYLDGNERRTLQFLANGDVGEVVSVHNQRELYGFHFADVTLRLPDYDNEEIDQTVILDSLCADAPALTGEQQQQLYNGVMEDYADISLKHDRLMKLKSDAYFNALQIKYAYAVTCHKAQGGQWKHVYIDQGYITADNLNAEYFHWLYTAFTRAREKLFLINWPTQQKAEAEA